MRDADEIQRMCFEARMLRLRAAVIIGQVTLAVYQLRQSLVERERLKCWSEELRLGNGKGRSPAGQNAQEQVPSL